MYVGPRVSITSNELPWLRPMPNVPENLTMESGIKFVKKNKLSISYNVAFMILIGFISSLVATGVIVYYASSCDEVIQTNTTNAPITHPALQSPVTFPIENQTYTSTDSTSVSTSTDLTTGVIESTTEVPKYSIRLPRSVIPQDYNLKIITFLNENFTFSGEVTIAVEVTEKTDNITLHSIALNISESEIEVRTKAQRTVKISKFTHDTTYQFFIINLQDFLEIGSYTIYIKYTGTLDNALQGFYRSSYVKNNKTRWLAATQFQPTDARRALPCFDEPAFKAVFKISIGRENYLTSISNMPKSKSEPIVDLPNYTWDHFEPSLPMSTYLVAFVVFDFDKRSDGNFTIWARKDAINQTAYSLEVGPAVLKYYENFFNMTFPLPKIDMVALPDFSAGAMENWGLITYRESHLLYEEGVSSRVNKQSVSIVVSHELGHQWFGNLVTPSWWTDLWLNEGFASYLEYIGTNAVHPEWRVLDQFVVYELQLVFSLDALKSSHPISIEVHNPEEINDIFDRISYGKGATIIRMMNHFLTTKVFQQGLTNYLNEMKYNSAQQDDLWKSLTTEAHARGVLTNTMSVKEIMDTWTLQTGFPVVTVNRTYETGQVQLRQERFILKGNASDALWWIPLTFTDKTNRVKKLWLKNSKTQIETSVKSSDWLLFNVNQTGYYRVNYDRKNWALIIAQLKQKDGLGVFDPKNRAQIVDDALNLATAGYIDYELAMNVTTYLVREEDYVPWKAAFRGLDHLYEMFLRSGHFDAFKKYLLFLITPLYKKIGFSDGPRDELLTTYIRSEVLTRACKLGLNDCINNAAIQFRNWRHTPDPDLHNPISPNLKSIVYCNAIKVGGEEEWDFVWERYLRTNVGSEREFILSALACTREPWLLNRYLSKAVTEGSGIRKQDAGSVISAVSRQIEGQHLSYRFLTTNWEKIKAYMGSSFMSLNNAVRTVTRNFNTKEELEDLKKFALKINKDLVTAARPITQAIEKTEANVQWTERNFDVILKWLQKFNQNI